MFEPFFGVPQSVVRSGRWKEMKPGERDLYICLMHRSERYSNREVTISDEAVRKEVGTAPRTLCNARKKLQERGLIQCRRIEGNKYQYIICDPETGKPYPGNSKTPIRYKKGERQNPERRSKTPVIAGTGTAVDVPAPASQKAAESGLSDDPRMTKDGLAGIFEK